MAKHFEFAFYAQPAEFKDGFVSVAYGVSIDCVVGRMDYLGTLADALVALAQFSDAIKKPHVAFIRMRYGGDRKPAGFDRAATRIEYSGF